MLEIYRKSYEELASLRVPNWKHLNRNELINSYIKYELENPELAEGYLGAIFCSYWNHISKLYSQCKNSGVTKEECYSWLVDGITFCLSDRIWLKPNSKLYGDPNGPDKAMNIDISTFKLIFYQSSNYDCRKANYGTVNVDKLLFKSNLMGDDSSKNKKISNYVNKIFSYKDKNYDYVNSCIDSLIIDSFNKGDYFLSFMVDCICHYYDVFSITKNKKEYKKEFSKKKLARCMNSLDNKYALSFASRFNIDKNRVIKAIDENIIPLTSEKIRKGIIDSLNLLKLKVSEGVLC